MKIPYPALAAALFCFGAVSQANPKKAHYTVTDSTVVTFASGTPTLKDDDIAKLRKAVEEAKAKGKIGRIEVAVWSDNEHPAKGDLAPADRKLANQRIDNIKTALKKYVGTSEPIKTFNMADNANWLERLLHTEESKLDAELAKGENGAITREDFAMIKEEGAPSKAVVIVKIRE